MDLRRVVHTLTTPFRLAGSLWLRSIQARVVVSTMVLSAIVITAVGWVLLDRTASQLTESRRESAIGVAREGFAQAQDELDAIVLTDPTTEVTKIRSLHSSLAASGGQARSYDVVLEGPFETGGAPDAFGGRLDTALFSGETVPDELRTQVASDDGVFWTYATAQPRAGGEVPSVVVGRRLQMPSDGRSYGLYYVFSMGEQSRTLSFILDGLLWAGVVLSLLAAGVAWLVTRQVVTPIGLARRIAERLAAGRLEERMVVRGHDDIARLGSSFNQMASSLQRQIRQLEELSRVQQRFVSDVSHELRTPLTTVRMAADVLHDGRQAFDDPVLARSAELLQVELDRFEALLGDLLEISRFDAGAAHLDVESIDLRDVAQRVVHDHRALADREGITLEVVGADVPVLVEADVRRIERVARNLVANAIKYSGSATVEVEVAGGADSVALAVRDHGIGLAPGESQLVFNRFWRADPARVRTSGGTGLGLAISLEDATLHGGWLQAWGEPGQGAQFRLTLPRIVGDEIHRSPVPLVPARRRTRTVTGEVGR